MNSMSGIVNRPAVVQFGKSRPPVPKTREELLAEDDAVFNIEDIEDITPPPTLNRGGRFRPLGILPLPPAEDMDARRAQERAARLDRLPEEMAALIDDNNERAALIDDNNERAAILANLDRMNAFIADQLAALLANDDEVDARLAEERDARRAEEMAVRLAEEMAALREDDGVGTPPALNREGESPPSQRRSEDDSNHNTNEDITPQNRSITNPLPAFAANFNPHSGESLFSNVQAWGHLTRQQETQRDRLMPTQEDINAIGGNALGGTPNSFNGFESGEISLRTPPPSPDGTLPFMPLNLDESPFSNVHSPQETQRPRLTPRPTSLSPIRNLTELFSLDVPHRQPNESQNSRPGTPDSQPDPNQQNQPD